MLYSVSNYCSPSEPIYDYTLLLHFIVTVMMIIPWRSCCMKSWTNQPYTRCLLHLHRFKCDSLFYVQHNVRKARHYRRFFLYQYIYNYLVTVLSFCSFHLISNDHISTNHLRYPLIKSCVQQISNVRDKVREPNTNMASFHKHFPTNFYGWEKWKAEYF